MMEEEHKMNVTPEKNDDEEKTSEEAPAVLLEDSNEEQINNDKKEVEPEPETEEVANGDLEDITENLNDGDKLTQESTVVQETGVVRSNQFAGWNRFTDRIKSPILRGLIFTARLSANHPYTTVAISCSVALFFLIVGFFTNFVVENEGYILWTPSGCNSIVHGDWVDSSASGFPQQARSLQVLVHAKGSNVLGLEGANRLFDVVDTIRFTPGYNELCLMGRANTDGECPINGATGFWGTHNRSQFDEEIKSDEDAIYAMSHLRFSNDQRVDRVYVFGEFEPPLPQNMSSLVDFNVSDVLLEYASAYLTTVFIPAFEVEALPFELEVTNRLFDLEDSWNKIPGNPYVLELNSGRSFDDELNRGISEDIPYMVVAFCLMGVFCAITLAKCHRIRSQSLLGVAGIVTIVLSILTGYGLLFVCGVPFTSLTQIFPYVMVGIGLDDTFILTGSFARKDPKKDVVDRIEEVMQEVGISIFVSTLTTFVAFMLGGVASLPGIRWFAWYAGPTVAIDFLFQITFFIAILALDDRRQQASRRDCCPCFVTKPIDEAEAEALTIKAESRAPYTTMFVETYANILMKPISKIVVLLGFAGLLVLGCIGASRQTQDFDFRDLTPADSFVRDFFGGMSEYLGGASGNTILRAGIYFRDIDVSEADNRDAMFQFVDDMVDMKYITSRPTSFWLRDFLAYTNITEEMQNLTFFDQLDVFLSTEPFDELYKNDIVRDKTSGQVTASRTFVQYDKINAYDQPQQIDALKKETAVAESQPLNSGNAVDDWNFFSLSEIYYAWELYGVIINEIVITVVVGLIAVAVIALIFVPHPFGALVVTPVVGMVYVELLAVLQVAGISINSVSAVGLTMSIGLVVDYNMHIVLTYFEIHDAVTREDRVKKVLTTMGKSIMLGGFSTFLGVLPLSLSNSDVFRTFFVTFLGIVFLGVGHGLIFTPVVLSLIAPHTPPVEAYNEEEEENQGKVLINDSGDESLDEHAKKAAAFKRDATTMGEDSSDVSYGC